MGNKCFNCGCEINSNTAVGLSDSYNEYRFCNIQCEEEFIEGTTFDSDGIYTTYKSI